MIIVPPGFGHWLDESDRPWLATLPALATKFCARWNLNPDGALMNGFVALVLPVRRADGSAAVLKLTWVDEETKSEPLALELWPGDRVVRLLDHDDEHGALLLERLDHTCSLLNAPIGEAVEVAGELLRDLRVPAPPGMRRMQAGGELADENAVLGNPVPKTLLDTAMGFGRELAATAGDTMVNEDLHYGNVLRGDRAPWLMIDPKPVAGDPEFCVFPLLSNRFNEMAGSRGIRDRFAALVDIGELDVERARGWTALRAVDNWLWALDHDFAEDAERNAAIAYALTES